jgi:predicted ArsR family transcriptional regulator
MDIASIERRIDEATRLLIVVIADEGGEAAVNRFLEKRIATVVGYAYSQTGAANACKLMFGGLLTAEALAEQDARP